MFIRLSAIYAALTLLASGVSGLPKRGSDCDDDNVDLAPRGKTLCSPGNWYNSTAAKPKCQACPAGYTCNGNQDPQPCDYGTYQPNVNSTTCISTVPGFYQDKLGQNMTLPCYLGSYQPYAKQSFCYGAPSGRFQGQTGQKAVCGACCGWYTKLENFNTKVYKCPSSAPYSGEASGSGCQTTKQGCTPVAKCAQKANGACRTCVPLAMSTSQLTALSCSRPNVLNGFQYLQFKHTLSNIVLRPSLPFVRSFCFVFPSLPPTWLRYSSHFIQLCITYGTAQLPCKLAFGSSWCRHFILCRK
ncbi:hypothetical protein C8F04DRAFT_1062857 [Mycena alexandri]|uniref:Uncharacterized protein n=1 Tax=Mycena alexandri TaxID=1745969 RepID=A0AAD6TIB4_9AGAR|nr:hypothetical protein C8F04DRAFT_1062857 [Mycena alexandri]